MASSSGTNYRRQTNSYDTTAANSYNTTDNSRSYLASGHIEVKDSTFHIWGIPRKHNIPTREELEKRVDKEINWEILSSQLSVADQDKHQSTISRLDWNEPKYFWITKNHDFTQWESNKSSQAVWLSGPDHCGMTEVSSHIIAAKERAVQPNSSVLYFFCSTATTTRGSISTVFAHTLLHQIVRSSSADKAKPIATTFLKSLLGENLLRFKGNLSPSTLVETILDAPDRELHRALLEAIKKADIQELLIIIDGIDITAQEEVVFVQNVYSLVKHTMHTSPKSKALITSSQNSDLQNTLGRLPHIEYDKERKECLRFLWHHDTQYAKIVKEHHGSLEWLWTHPQYLKWSASKTSSLLLIEGKPGSGKSTLTKYFHNNLVEREPIASSSTVAHYFYTFRGTDLERTHENMLRSILYSILKQDESTFFHFQLEFRKFRHPNLSEWPYDSLKTVLSSFANNPPTRPLYLILDAMDESDEPDRRDIIQLICRLCSAKDSRIKVFLSSRPVAELRHQIEDCHHVIRMQNENKDDIQKFVNDFLPDLKLPGPILRNAADYIIGNAEGVFVWVHLVKAELFRMRITGHNDKQIMDGLKDLPTQLMEFYDLMLKRLEGEGSDLDIQDGITIFKFVLFTNRPLTVTELQHILAIQHVHSLRSNPDNCLAHLYLEFRDSLYHEIEKRIMHCGGNFLEITADKTVQLMHQSAREFVLRIDKNNPDSKLVISNKEEVHITITMTSVRYLLLCFVNPMPTMRDNLSKIKNWNSNDFKKYARYMNEWSWVYYALHNLKDHHGLCGQTESVSQLINELIKQLTESQGSEYLGHWMACYFARPNSAWDFVWSMVNFQPLRYIHSQKTPEDFKYKVLDTAAKLGLSQVFDSLIQPCMHVDTQARSGMTLISCVRKGLVNALSVLLDRNEDLNAKDIAGRTLLHHAVENEHKAIVGLLLKRGANKAVTDKRGITALQLALQKLWVLSFY